jgi:prevent-host-death family protein
MPSYSVAEAKNQLSRLIDQANDGETVVITRHGKVVAELRARAEVRAHKVLSPEERKALYDHMAAEAADRPTISVSAVDLVRLDRDEGA